MTVFSLLGWGYVYMYFSMIDNQKCWFMGGFKNVYDVKAVDRLYKTAKTNFRNEKLDIWYKLKYIMNLEKNVNI